MEPLSLFDRVGGLPFFQQLVDEFYNGVQHDPLLLPLYPEAPDMSGAKRRLTLFLAQYWGGPTTYDDERGHPRLRLRHMPFRIGTAERDHWLAHMAAAVQAVSPDDEVTAMLMGYFVPVADQLRNDTGLPIGSSPRR